MSQSTRDAFGGKGFVARRRKRYVSATALGEMHRRKEHRRFVAGNGSRKTTPEADEARERFVDRTGSPAINASERCSKPRISARRRTVEALVVENATPPVAGLVPIVSRSNRDYANGNVYDELEELQLSLPQDERRGLDQAPFAGTQLRSSSREIPLS